MSDTVRQAPYPADTRAKGWRFELDYEQMEQSDTWALAAEVPMCQHALLMMWVVAWTQVPCGSFPNDESLIRAKCKVPTKMWASLRDVLMRGWWLAEDGRLYHDTVAARVQEMLDYRRKNAERVAAFKAAKREQQVGNALPTREQQAKNDTGTGTGTGTSTSEANASAGKPAQTKEELWAAGKSLLMAAGVPKAQCGSFVGKLVQDYGDQIVIDAVRSAVVATPADPREYLKATCQRLKGERKDALPPLTVESKAAEHTQELLRRQAEHDKAAVPPPAEVLEKLNRLKLGAGAQA